MENIEGLDVTTKVLSPADIWRDKDLFTASEKASRAAWENEMTDEQRAATLSVIERALDRLRDTVDVWVPASLAIKAGSCVDVKFRLMFTDIDQDIRQEELITKRVIAEAADNTKRLIEELEQRKQK